MFCHASLGKNEAIEHFPVGRRLAFDAAKGRLWAVCKACERWNLSPLEERWEAIEECERLFRDTKLRVSTENIGLARLKEGTTLVRVGDPQRPEMAAWRYGDQFHRRRRKYQLSIAGGVVFAGGLVVAGPMAGLAAGGGVNLANFAFGWYRHRTVARVRVNGENLKLSRRMFGLVSIKPEEQGGFAMEVPYKTAKAWLNSYSFRGTPRVEAHGAEALAVARRLLPFINAAGARPAEVADAVRVLEESHGTTHLFGSTAASWVTLSEKPARRVMRNWNREGPVGQLSLLPVAVRIALEMSLHEDDERRALEGELAELENRWREAEEVAAISDEMFLPSGVGAMLKRLKGDRG
jgi:hypothetical protein